MSPTSPHLTTAAGRALAALLRGDFLDGTDAVEQLSRHEREVLARAARRLVELTG